MSGTAKNTALGRRGEWFAARYLEQNGYRILECNYRSSHQEIDLNLYRRRGVGLLRGQNALLQRI